MDRSILRPRCVVNTKLTTREQIDRDIVSIENTRCTSEEDALFGMRVLAIIYWLRTRLDEVSSEAKPKTSSPAASSPDASIKPSPE